MDQYSREFIAEKARLRLDRFYRATRELGRVFKTEFILDYLSQPALRTRIRRGLLKGEQLHALARCVHYGRLGRLDQRDFERQTGAASCLLLILAAIIYWQIREIDRVLSEASARQAELFKKLNLLSSSEAAPPCGRFVVCGVLVWGAWENVGGLIDRNVGAHERLCGMGRQDDLIAYGRDSNLACRCCNGGGCSDDYVPTDEPTHH